MDETMDSNNAKRRPQPQSRESDPPVSVTTDELKTELWNAIMEDSSDSCDEDDALEEIKDTFDVDDYEDEAEERRSTLMLLSVMRPQLAERLGGPPAKHEVR
jgi:hypothetical protein